MLFRSLAHHVRTHQRSVRVVVLQERDQRRGHGDDLLRRHVHELHLGGFDELEALALAAVDALADEVRRVVELGVRLCNREALLFVRWEIDDIGGDTPLLDTAVGRLDESEVVDPTEGRQRTDEADVRPFRRLDRADPTVVAVVDVADVEAGALAREAARAERREASDRKSTRLNSSH